VTGVPHDPWRRLAARTPARIGLGRAGISLPTREVLAFALAHAEARDAVHAKLDVAALAVALSGDGAAALAVRSQTIDRAHYLRLQALAPAGAIPPDLAIVVGDGLSASAVMRHASALLQAFRPLAAGLGLSVSPAIIVEGARVAIGDEIAGVLGAKAVVVLIGERPGLSSPDSLGAYLTYGPQFAGCAPPSTDADRNCLSNIRPEGLTPLLAAARLAWLVDQAFRRAVTGVALKDESDAGLIPGPIPGFDPSAAPALVVPGQG
jgi:ethanolamine ammonia-lyase small subunit